MAGPLVGSCSPSMRRRPTCRRGAPFAHACRPRGASGDHGDPRAGASGCVACRIHRSAVTQLSPARDDALAEAPRLSLSASTSFANPRANDGLVSSPAKQKSTYALVCVPVVSCVALAKVLADGQGKADHNIAVVQAHRDVDGGAPHHQEPSTKDAIFRHLRHLRSRAAYISPLWTVMMARALQWGQWLRMAKRRPQKRRKEEDVERDVGAAGM